MLAAQVDAGGPVWRVVAKVFKGSIGVFVRSWPVDLCRRGKEVAHPHQVVSGQRQGEHPAHPPHSAMARLAQAATVLIQPKISSTRLRFC